MHFHGLASSTPWPEIPLGCWRLHDASVAWRNLEQERGKWDFTTLDKYATLGIEHNVDLDLTLGLTPAWASARPNERSAYASGNAAEPRNLDDWRDYVRCVATRYKGRILQYEIWNEPNEKLFFSGTPEQMVELASVAHAVLKEVDPAITVISPSVTGTYGVPWLDRFLEKGGGAYVDVIGYHFYVRPNPPEAMLDLVVRVKETMVKYGVANKPLWNTETGWLIDNHRTEVKPGTGISSKVLSNAEASAYVARSYILNWAAGVDRLYWYSWDNKVMGLTEADGKTRKPPAIAYGEVEKWLLGARMTSCTSDVQGTWIAQITRNGDYKGWIVWNPDRSIEFEMPTSWHVTRQRDLSGSVRPCSDVKRTEVGPSPILLEWSSKSK